MAEVVQFLGFGFNGNEVERILGDLFETHIPSRNEVRYRIDGEEHTVRVGDWVDSNGVTTEPAEIATTRALAAKAEVRTAKCGCTFVGEPQLRQGHVLTRCRDHDRNKGWRKPRIGGYQPADTGLPEPTEPPR